MRACVHLDRCRYKIWGKTQPQTIFPEMAQLVLRYIGQFGSQHLLVAHANLQGIAIGKDAGE